MASIMKPIEVSPLDNATYGSDHVPETDTSGLLSRLLASQSKLSIGVTILIILIAYDQSTPFSRFFIRFLVRLTAV